MKYWVGTWVPTRATIGWIVMGLLVTSCSTGVSEEDHAAVVAELAASEDSVAELQGDLESANGRISDLEADVDDLEGALSRSEDTATELAVDLEQAETTLDRARAALDAVEGNQGSIVDGSVLASVLTRGRLRCGIQGSVAGFSSPTNGGFSGLDVDFCRAVGAGVLGDADAVEYVPVSSGERFRAIRDGQVDVLMRVTTHTLRRDATLGEGVEFGPPTFYDGLSLMGQSDRFGTASDSSSIEGATICVLNAGHEVVLAAWAGDGVDFDSVEVPNLIEAVNRIQSGSCDVVAGDSVFLHVTRAEVSDVSGSDLVIFPTVPITREPLAPAYAQGDAIWGDIVDWVIYSTIIGEQLGLSSSNPSATGEEAERLLGESEQLAVLLGLPTDAFRNVIVEVGNYGEIYDRNLGPLGYRREGSLNALFVDGGLMYAPPAR